MLVLLLLRPAVTLAEQLPLKTYATADGLASDQINRIVRDSRGFMWFATEEGLSRFDGYAFTNYTTDQGLPHRTVNDILETRDGTYWIATDGGLCRFNPNGAPTFTVYLPGEEKAARSVTALAEDASGGLWVGTRGGVYRMEASGGQPTFQSVDTGMPDASGDDTLVEALLEDRSGTLWIGTGTALYRRAPDGRAERYTKRQGLPDNFIQSLLEDGEGHIWVGTRYAGLIRLVDQPGPDRQIVAHSYTSKDGLASNWVAALFQSSDGRLWAGTTGGLSEFVADEKGGHFRGYTTAQGLTDPEVWALAEDRDGSLWLGTQNGGALKLASNGFVTYTQADGLGGNIIRSILEDRSGALCVISAGLYRKFINRFDGKRFTATWPEGVNPTGWGWNQVAFEDHAGEWWLDTGQGLYRFPKVNGVAQLAGGRPKALYTTRDGLGGNDIFRLFEDSRGDIWVSAISGGPASLTRWERAARIMHRYDQPEGIASAPTAYREDAAGNLWMGFYAGGLARYREGRFTFFNEADGLPGGMIRDLYLDQSGRLWIASSRGGLGRVDDPAAERPRFTNLTTAGGLSSNDIWSVTSDLYGRIYAGTGRGLDQLEPATGHIKHFTTADGLARGKVEVAFRDHTGALWFGTAGGLSRFTPEAERPHAPPPVLVSGLRVAGVARRVSELGETEVQKLTLDAGENQVQIDFVGLDFSPGAVLRYQYKLEGADEDWSAPTDQRSVNYANLRPGAYRFLVRAVSADGLTSATPAVVPFNILPPLWQRWWFVLLAGAAVALAVHALYRYRLRQLLALERVRTRIATDLHDDIGSSLSQVSVLSEVVRRRVGADPEVAEPLKMIAQLSRDLVDSMSDIVWAINPKRDRLSDLTQRMRRHASDVFTARDIEFTFVAPDPQRNMSVGADTRREVFLIFKEGVNNLVRHSGCTAAEVEFRILDGALELTLRDNGRGFDPNLDSEGNGLASMRQRAAKLGGALDISSGNGHGTTLRLKAPSDGRRWKMGRPNGKGKG
ncbi:MAG TPA: two-component regulator propeller domain-containing protein [Pyrinomonadaceae bacterium]|nr:two-component regulator propeller domain-containing protein [Pyrinomonadaceae bacterium]